MCRGDYVVTLYPVDNRPYWFDVKTVIEGISLRVKDIVEEIDDTTNKLNNVNDELVSQEGTIYILSIRVLLLLPLLLLLLPLLLMMTIMLLVMIIIMMEKMAMNILVTASTYTVTILAM